MKVSGTDNAKEYLDKLDRGLKNRIATKENEIDQVNLLYEKKIQSAKDQGEDHYLNTLDQNQQRIGIAIKDMEGKLADYQNNLTKTQEKLAEQEKTLKDQSDTNLYNLKTKGETNYQDQFSKIVDNQRSLENESSGKMKTLEFTTNSALNKQMREAESRVSNLEHKQNLELNDRQMHFKSQLDNQQKNNNQQLSGQKEEFDFTLQKANEQNKRIFEDKIRIQQDRLNYTDKYHQSLLIQKEDDFKIKYENMSKAHQETLALIQKRFDDEVKGLVDSKSKMKDAITARAEDDFYNVTKLDPKITNSEKEMLFEIAVPKHEWENVHLSAQGRDVKITLGRKYADELLDRDGSRNRSSRSEMFSKEFKVADILNPKTITQKYEDGILSFKIVKL